MTGLRIHLFGGYQVTNEGVVTTTFKSNKDRALLAYLAIEADRRHTRDKLAGLLWPDMPDQDARSNLRYSLSSLRRTIGDRTVTPPHLIVDRDAIQFNVESDQWVDVVAASKHLAVAQKPVFDAEAGAEAASLYRGLFLEGFSLPDSEAFEEWLIGKREQLHRQILDTLQRLASFHEHGHDYDQAIVFARRLVELEPWQEEGHRQLMRLLAYSGRRTEALAQFDTLFEVLEKELGVEPEQASSDLYEQIVSGELQPQALDWSQPVVRGYELRESLGEGRMGTVFRAFQPVVGRDVAVKIIQPRFANHPQFIRRFEMEAQLVARLEHPHIVPLYDFWREPGSAFLVMRWLRGGSLADALTDGPWPFEQAAYLVSQIAEALNIAHRQGVVHRDIKPANILLDEAQNGYLSDFGIASLVEPVDDGVSEPIVEITTSALGYLSPEQATGDPVTVLADIYSLGVVFFELLTGQHPFSETSTESLPQMHALEPLPRPSDINGALTPKVDAVIEQATTKQPEARFPSALAMVAAIQNAGALSPGWMATPLQLEGPLHNPYKGLRAFQEADAVDFFGREKLRDVLLSRLGEITTDSRLLAIVGPSGSGKSSLVKAGLIPDLRKGALPGSERWFVVEMTPRSNPLEQLELGLLSVAGANIVKLKDRLRQEKEGYQHIIDDILSDPEDELLLVIDQFEELFNAGVNRDERDQFLRLLQAAASPECRTRTIIVLRADYYDRPLAHPSFSQLVQQHTEVVIPLTPDELASAVEKPAQRLGVHLENGLLTAILADFGDQQGALPMLQYALTELFEQRDGFTLTRAAYEAIGGVAGALVGRAESIFEDFDASEKKAARQLFLRLVNVGEDGNETRRRVLLTELKALDVDQQTLAQASEAFGQARLLLFDRDPLTRQPTVEVAHEALILKWERLRRWLDHGRADLQMQIVLAHSTAEWQGAKEDESYLLRGKRLDQFEGWMAATDLALTDNERIFLEASLAERNRRRAAETARLARQKVLERRSRRFLGALAAVLALATVIALTLSIYAFGQRRDALEAYRMSLTANARQSLDDGDSATALALAMVANQINDPPLEAQRTLLDAAFAPGARAKYDVAALFPGTQASVASLDISPDGATVLFGFRDGNIILWDWESGREVKRLASHQGSVNDIAFAPDGRSALSGGEDGSVILWNLVSGEPVRLLQGHAGPVRTVDYSSNGQRAVSGGYGSDSFADPGEIIMWDLENAREMNRLSGHKAGVVTARFALDDAIILASSGDAEHFTNLGTPQEQETLVDLIAWDSETGEHAPTQPVPGADTFASAISPDGQSALLGSYYNNTAALVDLLTGEILMTLDEHQDAVSAVAFSRDGQLALTGSHDGSLIRWDLETGTPSLLLKAHSGEVVDAVLSADGDKALSVTHDGELIIWDLDDAMAANRFVGHADMVYDTAYLPDGRRFLSVSGSANPAVASKDTSVHLWEIDTGELLQSVELSAPVLFQVAVTPDGKTALVSGAMPSVLLFDAESLQMIGSLEGHQAWVPSIAISPNGKYAVTGSVDGSLIVWDMDTHQMIHQLPIEPGGGWAVAIAPDDRTLVADTGTNWIGLWDIETGEQLREYPFNVSIPSAGSSAISFLPDGRSLIVNGDGGYLYQIDVEEGKVLRTLGQHNDIRTRVETSPDGDLALSSGMDGVLMLWDLKSGELIRRFGTPGQIVFDIDIRGDGLRALSGSSDNSIVEWQLDPPQRDELRSWIAENRYVRPLSCEERTTYQIEPLCDSLN